MYGGGFIHIYYSAHIVIIAEFVCAALLLLHSNFVIRLRITILLLLLFYYIHQPFYTISVNCVSIPNTKQTNKKDYGAAFINVLSPPLRCNSYGFVLFFFLLCILSTILTVDRSSQFVMHTWHYIVQYTTCNIYIVF